MRIDFLMCRSDFNLFDLHNRLRYTATINQTCDVLAIQYNLVLYPTLYAYRF